MVPSQVYNITPNTTLTQDMHPSLACTYKQHFYADGPFNPLGEEHRWREHGNQPWLAVGWLNEPRVALVPLHLAKPPFSTCWRTAALDWPAALAPSGSTKHCVSMCD